MIEQWSSIPVHITQIIANHDAILGAIALIMLSQSLIMTWFHSYYQGLGLRSNMQWVIKRAYCRTAKFSCSQRYQSPCLSHRPSQNKLFMHPAWIAWPSHVQNFHIRKFSCFTVHDTRDDILKQDYPYHNNDKKLSLGLVLSETWS